MNINGLFKNESRFIKQGIFKNFIVLFSGAAFAQLIGFLASPIISRLFSEKDFSRFGYWSSIVNVLGVVATLRYEQAIILPESDSKGKSLLLGSMLISLFIASLTFIISYLYFHFYGNLEVSAFVFSSLLAFHLALVGISQSLYYWFLRVKNFRINSLGKIGQSFGVVLAAILLGYLGLEAGLIYSYVLGLLVSVVILLYNFMQEGNSLEFRFSEIKLGWSEYSNFPIYSAVPSLINSFSTNLPVIIATTQFISNQSGQFIFVRQYLYIPLMYVSGSLSQVFFSEITEYIKLQKSIRKQTMKIFYVLLSVSLVIYLVLGVWGSQLFVIVFGIKWKLAGELAVFLAPAFLVNFVVSPLSMLLPSLNKLRILAIWQMLYCAAIISLKYLSIDVFTDFVKYYLIIEIFSFVLYFIIIMYELNVYERGILKQDEN